MRCPGATFPRSAGRLGTATWSPPMRLKGLMGGDQHAEACSHKASGPADETDRQHVPHTVVGIEGRGTLDRRAYGRKLRARRLHNAKATNSVFISTIQPGYSTVVTLTVLTARSEHMCLALAMT